MIVQTKTGVQLHGEIAKDPEIRPIGQKQALKFDLKTSSTKDASGKWQSFYVGVTVWHGLEQRDGMYQKGDFVTVTARELKSREYNGKTYYSVDADSIVPDDRVILRWMQQMIDLMSPAPPVPEMQPTEEPTPFDPPPEPAPVQTTLQGAQMYPGEQLSDYAPHPAAPPAADLPADYDPINDDAADLPF